MCIAWQKSTALSNERVTNQTCQWQTEFAYSPSVEVLHVEDCTPPHCSQTCRVTLAVEAELAFNPVNKGRNKFQVIPKGLDSEVVERHYGSAIGDRAIDGRIIMDVMRLRPTPDPSSNLTSVPLARPLGPFNFMLEVYIWQSGSLQ